MNRVQLKEANSLEASLTSIERAFKSSPRPSSEMFRVGLNTNEEESQPLNTGEVQVTAAEWIEWLTHLKTKRLEALERLGVKP